MNDIEGTLHPHTETITPIAKLLMGESLYEVTKNISYRQYLLLLDDLLSKTYNYDSFEVINNIIEHGQIELSVVEEIINNWPTYNSWPDLFGVTKDSEIVEVCYYRQYPEIKAFYKLRYSLALRFGIQPYMWDAPTLLSDDVENDLYVMIQKSTCEQIERARYSNRHNTHNKENMVFTLWELFKDNDRFAQRIKLTNSDLAVLLNESW